MRNGVPTTVVRSCPRPLNGIVKAQAFRDVADDCTLTMARSAARGSTTLRVAAKRLSREWGVDFEVIARIKLASRERPCGR